MVKSKSLLLRYLLFIVSVSCSYDIPQNKIDKVSEFNNNEILKTYKKYLKKKDTLKQEAFEFLIDNCKNKYSYIGLPFSPEGTKIHELMKLKIDHKKYLDKIKSKSIQERSIVYEDKDSLKYKQLVECIEYSFKAYAKPWAKDISFQDFKLHILPYRFLTEPVSSFKKHFFELLEQKLDSIFNDSGINGITNYLTAYLNKNFSYNGLYKYMDGYQSVETIIESKMGDESDLVILQASLFSSCGIPVKIHNSGSKHWCLIQVNNKWFILQQNSQNKIELTDRLDNFFPHYVCELRFDQPENHPLKYIKDYYNIPNNLYKYYLNVTNEYATTYSHNINWINDTFQLKHLYLNLLTNYNWESVDYYRPDNIHQEVKVSNLVSNSLYSISGYEKMIHAWPNNQVTFFIDKKGTIHHIKKNNISPTLSHSSH